MNINIQVGDRVRVVAPEITFNDYDAGDTGTVTEVEDGGVHVKWDRARFESAILEGARCAFLYNREIERINEAVSQADEE